MKKSIIGMVALLLFNPFTILTQIQDKTPSIEVFGNADVKVKPDILNLSVSFYATKNTLNSAKDEVDRSVAKVLAILKNAGIDDNDIQTAGIRINGTDRTDNEGNTIRDYQANNAIGFSLKDLSKYYDIITEIVQVQHTFISNSAYDYSKKIESRKHAREEALLAAKSKAEEMAAVLGQEIGKPLLISEEPVSDYYPNPFNASVQEGNQNYSSSYTLQQGTIDITAKVRIVFELVNKP